MRLTQTHLKILNYILGISVLVVIGLFVITVILGLEKMLSKTLGYAILYTIITLMIISISIIIIFMILFIKQSKSQKLIIQGRSGVAQSLTPVRFLLEVVFAVVTSFVIWFLIIIDGIPLLFHVLNLSPPRGVFGALGLTVLFFALWLVIYGFMASYVIEPIRGAKPGSITYIYDEGVYGGYGGKVIEFFALSLKSPYKAIIFIRKDLPTPVFDLVKAHEEAHVRGHHSLILISSVPFIYSLLWSLFMSGILTAPPRGPVFVFIMFKLFLLLLALGFLSILVMRVFESKADAATYRVFGERAYDYLVQGLRLMYGDRVRSPRDVPFVSRLMHTSSRDAARTGDPLSSIGLWEFPVVFSFLAAVLVSMRASSLAVLSLLLPAFLLSSLIAIVLLGLVFLPVTKRFYGGTRRGYYNFSFLLSGIYTIISYLGALAFPDFAVMVLVLVVGLALAFLVIRSFLGRAGSALKLLLITYLIFVGVNALIFSLLLVRVVFFRGVVPWI